MLTYWIPKEPCMLPANASHQVGVGGFVITEKSEVILIFPQNATLLYQMLTTYLLAHVK